VEALKACTYPGSNLTVTEIMQEKVMSIGENMQIRRFSRFAENTSVAYVHAGGTHGVLVNLAVEGDIDATEIGKNVAMQIAAMGAKYWDKSLVPQAEVDKEMSVQLALMDNDPKMAGKPAQVKEKIAAGKIAAFFKDICLLQQEFVRADLFKGDVAGYIADAAKKLGGKVTFVDAIHYIKAKASRRRKRTLLTKWLLRSQAPRSNFLTMLTPQPLGWGVFFCEIVNISLNSLREKTDCVMMNDKVLFLGR